LRRQFSSAQSASPTTCLLILSILKNSHDHKPLYFLTHDGSQHIFSRHGVPIQDREKSPLVGMLMVERSARCPESYIRDLKGSFKEVSIGPMTLKGDRGPSLWPTSLEDSGSSIRLLKNLKGSTCHEINHLDN
jgi:hypothetical protein